MVTETGKASGTTWDLTTQTYHGGQDWKFCDNFVEDFSVTTNHLGTPASALKACAEKLTEGLHHYPSADFEPAKTHLASFLGRSAAGASRLHERLLMGNGASELIDLVIRLAPKGVDNTWRPSPFMTQYKEYERAAVNSGRKGVGHDDNNASLCCIVNPCNPTGDFMDKRTMQEYIRRHCKDGSTLIVDESMQPWFGTAWKDENIASDPDFVDEMYTTRNVAVFVIHSWTKIWSCPAIRLGSITGPVDRIRELKKYQVPWSVNTLALAFTEAAIADVDYLQRTWDETTRFRAQTVAWLQEDHPKWVMKGEAFLSWIWIDTGCSEVADKACELGKQHGVPVRAGKHGYNCPTVVRVAVRAPEAQTVLRQAWKSLA